MLSKQNLKQAGLKITKPRLKILHIFENNSMRHLSAEDIYNMLKKEDEEVSLATVYRVLAQFETAGILIRLNFNGDQSVFELDSGEHHDHLICISCHAVEEFYDPIIEKRQHEIAARKGFDIIDHSLYLYVKCKKCLDKEKNYKK